MANKVSLSSLESSLERMRFIVDKREESFSNKSERWQESEKGEAYSDRTDELSMLLDDLENAIDALTDWNEEYER